MPSGFDDDRMGGGDVLIENFEKNWIGGLRTLRNNYDFYTGYLKQGA